MTGAEVNFIVEDVLGAIELYKKIFDINVIEVTNLEKGKNEVIFSLYGTRFHMLDENVEYNMYAPKAGHINTIWFNILVDDIKDVYSKAIKNGCKESRPVTMMEEFGASNAIFTDTYGYVWLLHQIHEVKSFEDRIKAAEKLDKHQ